MNILRSLKGFYFLELSKSFFEPRVLTRLGRICLHPSQVTVGEKAWEALMSFPQGGELKVFELKVFEQKVFRAEYEKRAKSGATGPIVGGTRQKNCRQHKKQTKVV